MRRRIGSISIVWVMRRLRTSRWIALFAIGAMLGATLLFIRLSLGQLQELSLAASIESTDTSAQTAFQSDIRSAANGTAKVDREMEQNGTEMKLQQMNNELEDTTHELDRLIVRIYMTKEKRIERVPLETYVRGVVAAEMPIDFELEALKAQAIAARTYIIRRIVRNDDSGVLGQEADVTDTVNHQVYISAAKLAGKWSKEEQKTNLKKLDEMIDQTRGMIITYEGEPIEAAFFSTSNGYTENSEDYWTQEIPYLRSVASPWDEVLSPRYKETVKMKLSEFYSKLGVKRKAASKPSIRIVERTEGKRISKIVIGGATYTGREVREKLALPSSQFTWSIKGDSIAITTFGYGHGVGMSQWGANGMAKEGARAERILAHYYSSTTVEQASKLSAKLLGRS